MLAVGPSMCPGPKELPASHTCVPTACPIPIIHISCNMSAQCVSCMLTNAHFKGFLEDIGDAY